jgi:DNA invertase Pin-like site-specific DNA recombinase
MAYAPARSARAVLRCLRLARNGRDWHHLLELCGLVEARVIDLDGVYNPCRPNDRLLLGMKGSISEFELGVLRARMLDAARAKARRGRAADRCAVRLYLASRVRVGPRSRSSTAAGDPAGLQRFRELGSARQTHLSLARKV